MTQLFTHQWFGTPDNLLMSCILLFVTPNIWRSHVLISTDADFRAIAPPNSRFESRETPGEWRVASAVPRGAGSAGRNLIIRDWTIQSLEQLEIMFCNRSASLFQNAEVLHLVSKLERYPGFLYFCWTNPSDIPIFGNTGWWIMFRPLGRPLILLPDQRNRFAICPRRHNSSDMKYEDMLQVVGGLPVPE